MSELGAPITLGDTLANPTKAPFATTFMLAFNGTTWFRVPGSAAGGLTVSPAAGAVNDVNLVKVNGNTALAGNGTTGTGSPRVTIASDNTAFSVNATLSTETTKTIGVTRSADGSGNLLTSTGAALDVNLKTSSITLPVSGTVTANIGTLGGGATFGTGLTISVTNAATVLLVSNASRKGALIVNNGATDIFVGLATVVSGATATAAGGFLLKANGGSYETKGDGLYTGPLSGITAAGTSVVAAYEW